MRLYILFSTISYLILTPFLYRATTIYMSTYSIEFYSFNFWIYLVPLIFKVGLDTLYALKKNIRDILTRVNSLFFITTILIVFLTIPKTQVEIEYRNGVIQKMLSINDSLFKYYNHGVKKLPPDFIINNIIKNENQVSPFLKKGKPLKYSIFLLENDSNISQQEPGTIILVLDKDSGDYYLSMIIWNHITNKKEFFSINGEVVIIGSKSSLEQMKIDKIKREEHIRILKEQSERQN